MEYPQTMNKTLTLKINDLMEARGAIRVAVFQKEKDFLHTDKAVFLKVIEVNNIHPIYFEIDSLTYGEYAIAVFHDLNHNGKLDTNWLGIPKEPYAFSNDAGKKWKKPSFSEAKISFDARSNIVELNLRSWKSY